MSERPSGWRDTTVKSVVSSVSNAASRLRAPSPLTTRQRGVSPAHSDCSNDTRSTTTAPHELRRLPSYEAMSRSNHNAIIADIDGTDDSNKDTIISMLKKSNSELTSKYAEMEAKFMNQINALSTQMATQHDDLKQAEETIEILNHKVITSDKKIKEKEGIISTLKDETSFQKQNITDLKNELFNMQNEIEDSEYDNSEVITKMAEKAREAQQKIFNLEKECQEWKIKVESMLSENHSDSVEVSMNGTSSPSAKIKEDWLQLEITQEKLREKETLLEETLSSLATLEKKYKSLTKKHADDLDIQARNIKYDADRQVGELKSMLRARDDIIGSLHSKLETYDLNLSKLEEEVDRLNDELSKERDTVKNQSEVFEEKAKYEEKISLLERELKDRSEKEEMTQAQQKQALQSAQEALENEKTLNSTITQKYEELSAMVKAIEEESRDLKSCTSREVNEKEERIIALENELKNATSSKKDRDAKVSKIKEENELLHKQLESQMNDLNLTMESFERYKKDTSDEISKKEKSIQELESSLKLLQDEAREKDEASSASQQSELTTLKSEIESLTKQLEELSVKNEDALSDIREKDEALNAVQEELVAERERFHSTDKVADELRNELKEKSDALRKAIDLVECEKAKAESLTQQLSEFKEADKTEVTKAHDEMTSLKAGFEEEKRDLVVKLERYETDIAKHEKEIQDLQSRIDTLNEVEKLQVSLTKKVVDYEAIISENEEKISQLEAEATKLKDEIIHLQDKSMKEEDGNSKYISELKQEVLSEKARNNTLSEEINDLQKNLDKANNDSVSYKKVNASLRTEINNLKREIEGITSNPASQDVLMEEVKNLKEQLRQVKEDTVTNENESPTDDVNTQSGTVRRSLYLGMERKYKKEISDVENKRKNESTELKAKLADRDKTISTIMKASLSQEEKIKTMKEKLQALGAEDGDSLTSKLEVKQDDKILQQTLTEQKKLNQSLSKQIVLLKAELSKLKNSPVKTNNPEETEKRLREYKNKLKERDEAIANLVKSSITQEQQINMLREEIQDAKAKVGSKVNHISSNPTWDEYTTLQQESEIFAGQIIEQDEEIENLRRMLQEEILRNANTSNQDSKLKEELNALQIKYFDEKVARNQLESEIQTLTSKLMQSGNRSKLIDTQREVHELEVENSMLREEIRELKRQIRILQPDANRAIEMERELKEARDELDVTRKNLSRVQYDEMEEGQRKIELETAIEKMEAKGKELVNIKLQLATLQEKEALLQSQLDMAIADRDKVEKLLAKNESQIEKLREQNRSLKDQIRDDEESRRDMEETLTHEIKELREQLTIVSSENSLQENEAFAELQKEVESLRMKLRSSPKEDSNDLIAALTEEINNLRDQKESSERDSSEIISALSEEVKKLREDKQQERPNNPENDSEDIIAALTQEVKDLHEALNEKQSEGRYPQDLEATIRGEMEEEITSMRAQKEYLGNEVARLQSELEAVADDRKELEALRKEMSETDGGRVEFEKTLISTYERKLSLMQMNKDLTIDQLRKELATQKERQKEMEKDLLNSIKKLESEKSGVEVELEAKMRHKNMRIQYLEQNLAAHEQISGHMKQELDQLQSGMETASVSRRAEFEELQEDLMSVQSKANKYEREITNLKMQMEEMKLRHRNEVSRLKEDIYSLESDNLTPSMRDIEDQKHFRRAQELAEEVERMKIKVGSVQEENYRLRSQIDKLSESRPSKNDKWRNSALQEQVIVLTQRLKELEGDAGSVHTTSSRRTAVTSRASTSDSPFRVPRSPGGSRLRSGRDPQSRMNNNGDDHSVNSQMTY